MKVLIHISWPVKAWCIPDEKVALLRAEFPDVEFVHVLDRNELTAAIADVDACFVPALTPERVAAAAKLRWLHSPAAAVEGLLPLADLAAKGVVVTNSRGVQGVPIAEHVMGGLLALSHKYDRMIVAQREHRWIQNDLFTDSPWLLQGKRMTIIGVGNIGGEIAKRARAFDVHVTGVRRRANQPLPEFVDEVYGADQLDRALANCDILVIAAPGVASTARMIGAEQLAMLNRGAVLVNVARAQIVDDAAMRAALTSGQLGGAILDVFEQEPLDAAHPLWAIPNVIITPHSSGFRSTHWDDVIAGFRENLKRYQAGEPLNNVVDLAAGY